VGGGGGGVGGGGGGRLTWIRFGHPGQTPPDKMPYTVKKP